jgi:hypothetical protein
MQTFRSRIMVGLPTPIEILSAYGEGRRLLGMLVLLTASDVPLVVEPTNSPDGESPAAQLHPMHLAGALRITPRLAEAPRS